jgi:hypothetical protein
LIAKICQIIINLQNIVFNTFLDEYLLTQGLFGMEPSEDSLIRSALLTGCSVWASLVNCHNQKHTLERNASLSHTEQFLEKIHGNHLIEDVLNKTHILDFPDSFSFGQKSRVKFVTQFLLRPRCPDCC